MKKYMKYVFVILIVLCSMMIGLCIVLKNNEMKRNSEMEVKEIMVGNMVATYEYR